jgi:hypothetical protein
VDRLKADAAVLKMVALYHPNIGKAIRAFYKGRGVISYYGLDEEGQEELWRIVDFNLGFKASSSLPKTRDAEGAR